jgi:hypothetical protein
VLFDPSIRDGKNLDPGYISQINFPKDLKQFLGLKILQFFDADQDPGSGTFLTLDPDPG